MRMHRMLGDLIHAYLFHDIDLTGVTIVYRWILPFLRHEPDSSPSTLKTGELGADLQLPVFETHFVHCPHATGLVFTVLLFGCQV